MGRGTGNLPYLDFISCIIRYIYYIIPKEEFQYDQNSIDNENFDFIRKDFKLIYLASYYNEPSPIMHEIFIEAAKLDKKYKLGKFEYFYEFDKNVTKKKWNVNFYNEILLDLFDKIKNIYLCGTSIFMEYAFEELISTTRIFEKNIIYI